jgi:hypothetical protein
VFIVTINVIIYEVVGEMAAAVSSEDGALASASGTVAATQWPWYSLHKIILSSVSMVIKGLLSEASEACCSCDDSRTRFV